MLIFLSGAANQSRVTLAQCLNSTVPSILSCPAAWLDQAMKMERAQRRDAGSSFWVCTLFGLSLYLFRCKSVSKECYVLSLCSGWWTGSHLLEEVSPVEIGALQIVFHYKAIIDVRGWHHVAEPFKAVVVRKSSHTHLLFITQHIEDAGLIVLFQQIRHCTLFSLSLQKA